MKRLTSILIAAFAIISISNAQLTKAKIDDEQLRIPPPTLQIRINSIPAPLNTTNTSGTIEVSSNLPSSNITLPYFGIGTHSILWTNFINPLYIKVSIDLTTKHCDGGCSGTWWTGKGVTKEMFTSFQSLYYMEINETDFYDLVKHGIGEELEISDR